MPEPSEFRVSVDLPAGQADAFDYHSRRGCLERLLPPWENNEIVSSDNSIAVGSRVVLRARVLGGLPVRCVAEHVQLDAPEMFVDEMVSGPFRYWRHEHRFLGDQPGTCTLRDDIRYRLPGGRIGNWFGGGMVRRQLESMFAYRHRVVSDDLRLARDRPSPPMRIGISGSGGLVGGHLVNLVRLLGHEPIRLVRHDDCGADAVNAWPVTDGPGIDLSALEGVRAVVHLAGKSIASGRWTREVKQEIRDSRVIKTRQLCESLARLANKPEVLVCASATGIYGDRGDEICDENTSPGGDFLADVAEQWEAACRPATDAGIRVVHARFGLVLSPQGGALEKMLLPAKLCGGKLGSGDQWYSWISIDDAIGALYHCLADQSVSGPVNFVAPNPVPNAEFARTLGRVLGRPALFPAPAFGLRLALGEMADALLLGGVRVAPLRLQQAGYRFRFSGLEEALRYLLGKNRLSGSGAPPSGE